ncbi:MAG: helix-turn-helix transcriptional regulator [Sarcina sp.]
MKLEKLKEERIKKNITQKDMADLLKITKSTYCRKENGSIVFKLDEVKLIQDYLKLNKEDIFKIFL